MNDNRLSKNNNEDLINEKKNVNSTTILNAVLIGLLVGISIYSTAKNGLGFFTFFPLFFVYLLIRRRKIVKK
ncbi:hypothetical protein RCH19_001509 [Flavobacterium sp. PL12]